MTKSKKITETLRIKVSLTSELIENYEKTEEITFITVIFEFKYYL